MEFPWLPLLCLTSRIARAPKLNRRAKGVAGVLPELAADGGGSSSKGLSSTEPELALDRLSVRGLALVAKGDVWLLDAVRPMVVSDRRRRWALTAADVMGPGNGCVVAACPLMLFWRPNKS